MKRILIDVFLFAIFSIIFLDGSRCYQEENHFYGDVRILESNDKRLIFEYYPQVKKEYMKSGEYVFYNVSNCSYPNEVGNPMIPERCIIIGVPVNGNAELKIIENEFYNEKTVKFLPVPSLKVIDDISYENYLIDEKTYSSNSWINESICTINSPEFIRKQRIQKINIYPIDYQPSENLIRIYKRIKIEVNFSGDFESYGKYYSDNAFENVYKNLILNYEQCKNWRMDSPKKIKKQTLQEEGIWYKINVNEEGIYILDKKYFSDKNIDLSGIDPRTIKIYNNGGRELPQDINVPRQEGLIENSIYVFGEEDGRFDDNDFIIFYGIPTFGWDYSNSEPAHYIHHYQNENIYWLTFDGKQKGKRLSERKSISGVSSNKPENFKWRVFVENELNKIYESGINWYGAEFRNGDSKEVKVKLLSYVENMPIKYKIALKGGSAGRHNFTIFEKDVKIADMSFYSFDESVLTKEINLNITNDETQLIFKYDGSLPVGRAFIDWIEVEYTKMFKADDNVLFFESPTGNGEYTITGFAGNDFWIFDISNPVNVKRITDFTVQSNKISFGDTTASPERRIFAVLEKSKFKKPANIIKDENSDIRVRDREVDFIIITYDDFYNEAMALRDWRESNNGLKTELVKISNIYDEFSGGLMDAVAIRDFLRFAYLNWRDGNGNPPGYALLFGDGSYDFKNVINKEKSNFIPPFEIDNDNELYTRCTDDWYVYIEGNDRLMDMTIGRLPVSSKSEALSMVNKLINYEKEPEFGFWRNTITFVADDELTPGDNTQRIHTDQSEEIANAKYIPGILNERKIYLMDYPGEKSITSSEIIKPRAEKEFVEQINQGSSIISYIGHGSYKVLAQEKVLSIVDDLPLIENGKRLFFFYPATCAFGRYDFPEIRTFTEELLFKENSGAIGILTSAREAFASQNFNLAQAFYQNLFENFHNNRLGDVVVTAKGVVAGNYINNEKFHLFCDPTLRLNLPKYNTTSLVVKPDSMKALASINVNGKVLKNGEKWDDYEGKISMMSYDSEQKKTYIMENGESVPYVLPGVPIFRGTSAILKGNNGEFNLKFIVPKDITYGGTNGRISVYFFNESVDGAGFLENIFVGGTADVQNDFKGPDIKIGFEEINFVSGDFIPENPILNVTMSDENGINITGEPGHRIEFVLDENVKNNVDLTKLFVYNESSYTEGVVKYPFGNISKGKHTLKVKAWDNFNNSSEEFAEFTIYSEKEYSISKVFNYPNPFSEDTRFTFEINQPVNSVSDITIKIFTVSGRLIKEIENIRIEKPGLYVSEAWNGRDEDGNKIANGVYFFKVIAKAHIDDVQKTAESIEKIVIMR